MNPAKNNWLSPTGMNYKIQASGLTTRGRKDTFPSISCSLAPSGGL